ncbi:type VI secretion system lipoprotein TssJ [Caldimonas brevitalea]|uniref:Type VI secretion system protein VasD n=1 Tax=Caldimonas brevitalea TaxID=413882 RepID=A0A0G3BLK3_9BURK|nr:type VI secretion system lipoprotein TssJ [Caldimonas brevitalea]AKJ28868.1 type VI secretion system protein VasD [Caldimonas brevitalea]
MTSPRLHLLFKWLFAALLGLLLAACAGGPKPTRVEVQLAGNALLNPDSRNRPSPAMVRVYELKTPAAFESADFFSLFDKDRETLAADLNARDEFVLQPGQTLSFKRDTKPDTRYVAVMVAYRDLEHARWRAVGALNLGKSQVVRINAGPRAVELAVARK